MSIKNSIIKRRTTHHFKNEPIDDTIIDEALKLAVYAPNHHLTFPYHFYKIKGRTRQQLLDYAYETFKERSSESADQKLKKWSDTPGWIVVTQKISDTPKTLKEDYATMSIVMYILMLALDEKGIGAKWSTASLFFTKRWYNLCAIDPAKEEIIGMLWYGYADREAKEYARPTLDHYSSILG